MSSGFTDKQKAEIREKLILCGYELAANVGFKKMTVADIAKAAGVAVGSFYGFFDSKESFAAAMLGYSEAKAYASMPEGLRTGKIELEEFMRAYRECFRPENNIWLNFRLEDWVWIKTHIKDSSYFTNISDIRRVNEFFSHINGIRKDADPGVVANFIKMIYAMYQNRDTFFENVMQKNVDLIFDMLYRYIKEQ